MRPAVRTIALIGPALALLAGCAQPGQLGSSQPEVTVVTVPATAAPVAPAPDPGLDVSGRLADPLEVSTPGPAVFAVRTVTVEPGETSGWLKRPGTATTLVRSGVITVLTDDDCRGTSFAEGQAVFVSDGRPQQIRNDGTVPADLVVTTLLAPDAPERETVPDPC